MGLTLCAVACAKRPERPETPAILRDVAMSSETGFTHPYVPGVRTTVDGRIGLAVGGETDDKLRFYLLVPEKLSGPVMSGPPGPAILADTEPFAGGIPLRPNGRDGVGHHALCDVRKEFLPEGARANPYPCGEGGARDCYDFVHFGYAGYEDGYSRLWGTPVHVEVSAPKTPEAQIADIQLGASTPGPTLPGPVWFEPMATWDGRLLTGRRLDARNLFLTWTNPETGEKITRPYDIMYSLMAEGASPCDVTAWETFHPITHAHHDPRMRGRYGFAEFPIRDPEGRPIPDGEEIAASYPWLDRAGKNLFMTIVPSTLLATPEDMYPRRCLVPGCESDPFLSEPGLVRGHAVAGLWTQGKMVHIDGLMNNTDWSMPLDPKLHMMVTLFKDGAGSPVEVRVGGARQVGRASAADMPPAWLGNTNVLDSIENLFNFHQYMKPVTPADIVWILGNGRSTDEFAFDDYLNPDSFIVSGMMASTSWSVVSAQLRYPRYHTGFQPLPVGDYVEDIHLQNGATATADRWAIPAYGHVASGTGRAEEVALGGVKGRGFWLTGANRIEYRIPPQPTSIRDHDWFVGIFLDARFDDDAAVRDLVAFPDGSALRVRGRRAVLYANQGGDLVHEVALPHAIPHGGWAHLGFNLRDENREISFFLDGFAFDVFAHSAPLFEMTPGMLLVGDASGGGPNGFRGWIDDFKVFARAAGLEVACNHAGGTTIGIEDNAAWATVAAEYPDWAHEAVTAALAAAGQGTYARYACYRDYTADFAAHLGNIPAGARGVRKGLAFPESPLRFGRPRPDSLHNAFCLTCHTSGAPAGLSLGALVLKPDVNVEDDRRRQPSQPLPLAFGNIPANWIAPGPGPGGPAAATVAPEEGVQVDRWVLAE